MIVMERSGGGEGRMGRVEGTLLVGEEDGDEERRGRRKKYHQLWCHQVQGAGVSAPPMVMA